MSGNGTAESRPTALSEMSDKVLALPDHRFLAALKVLVPVTDTPETLKFLDLARERLRDLRPDRPISVKRQLCVPFETLLHSGEPGRPGRIARQALEPVWAFLNAQSPKQFELFQTKLRQLDLRDGRALFELSTKLWEVSATLLERHWPEAPMDLHLIRQSLISATNIEAVKAAFPVQGSSSVPDQAIDLICKTIVQFKKAERPLDSYLLVVASQLDNPLKLLSVMEEKAVPIPGSIAEQLDSVSVDALIARSDWFCNNADDLSLEAMGREVEKLTADLREARACIGRQARLHLEKSTGPLTARLRETIKRAVLDDAVPAVTAALDATLSSSARTGAERHARTLRKVRHAAKDVGLQPAIEHCLKKIHAQIDSVVETGMHRLRQAAQNGGEDKEALAVFYRAIRLMELVDGSAAVGPLLDQMLTLGKQKTGTLN